MKHIKDMNPVEVESFRDLMTKVKAENELVPDDFAPQEKVAMMVMVIKTINRSATNIVLEYDLDPDLFVRDAIKQLEQSIINMLALIEEDKLPEQYAKVARKLAEGQSTLVRHPQFRQLVSEVFVKFIEHARRER